MKSLPSEIRQSRKPKAYFTMGKRKSKAILGVILKPIDDELFIKVNY